MLYSRMGNIIIGNNNIKLWNISIGCMCSIFSSSFFSLPVCAWFVLLRTRFFPYRCSHSCVDVLDVFVNIQFQNAKDRVRTSRNIMFSKKSHTCLIAIVYNKYVIFWQVDSQVDVYNVWNYYEIPWKWHFFIPLNVFLFVTFQNLYSFFCQKRMIFLRNYVMCRYHLILNQLKFCIARFICKAIKLLDFSSCFLGGQS